MSKFCKTKTKKFKNKKKKSFCNFKFDLKTLVIVVTLLIVTTGFLYLIEVNSAATKGYEIKDLEKEMDQLKEKNEKLRLSVIELQSIQKVNERVADLSMVAIKNVEYASADSAMAIAR